MRTATRYHRAHAQRGCWQQWTAPLGASRKGKGQVKQAADNLLHRRKVRAMHKLIEVQSMRRWKQTQLKAGLKRLRNLKLSAGWHSWVAMGAERREAMELMRRGVSFLVNRKLAPAFRSWLVAIGAASSSAESAQRQRDSMAKSLLHLLHRELSRGWVGWHAQWQEAVRKRESARRGLRHMTNCKLSAGWNSWAEMVAERREAMDLMRRSLTWHATLLEHLRRWRAKAASCELAGLLRLQRAHALQDTATVYYATVLGRRALRVWASHWHHTLRREQVILQRRRDGLLRGFSWLQAQRARALCLRRSCAHWWRKAHIKGWNAVVTAGIRAVKLELLTSRATRHAVFVALVRQHIQGGLLVAPQFGSLASSDGSARC